MANVFNIAKYIYDKGYATDNIKLNKLMYISFGFYGATNKEYLFEEVIEAWEYGPVIPDVYYAYKNNEIHMRPLVAIPEKMRIIIDQVLSVYGNKAPFLLVELTLQENTPWSNVFEKGKKHIEIPKIDIIDYYTSFLNRVERVQKTLNTESFKRIMVELAAT